MPANYRDPTHITDDSWIDQDKVSEVHKLLSKWLREEMYGEDVRESLARLVEQTSSDLYDDKQIALALEKLAQELQLKWDNDTQKIVDEWKNTIGGLTADSEVINARINVKGVVYKTLKERLDAMENERFTIKSGESNVLITLQDDKFSQNHLLVKEGEVDSSKGLSGLIIAEVDNVKQDTFYLKRVGEI